MRQSLALFGALTFNVQTRKEPNAELKSTFCYFFPRLPSVRCVSQTFAKDVPHGYKSFKHTCYVIIGYVGGRLA